VTATVIDRACGREMTGQAAWVIAADGSRSPVRSMLNIGMVGPGPLAHLIGIYLRADPGRSRREPPGSPVLVGPSDAVAVMAAVRLADLWLCMVPFRPENGERPEDFTEDRCARLTAHAAQCGPGQAVPRSPPGAGLH